MEKKLWFKNKKYGYGWAPASWEGWLMLVLYTIVLVLIFLKIDVGSHSGSDTLIRFALPFIFLSIGLIAISRIKGEKPGWHWGEKGEKNREPS